MKILAHCYTYGNNAASGADRMLQSLLEYLSERGCTCKVVIDNCTQQYTLNNVQVQSNRSMLGEAYDWCDIVIIHLVAIHEAVRIAKRFGKPVVHICHNEHARVSDGYVVYNTHWLAQKMALPLPSIVVHPPTKPVPYVPHFNCRYITLVNTNDNKGGAMLKALAIQMPRYNFLGVHGGYDKNQMIQPIKNVMYRSYDVNGMDYSDTRIVIVPSKAESWSLVAAEAMAHGIPVICGDLPGLRENCGDAAIYCSSVREYMEAILLLRDEYYYAHCVEAGLARFASHNYSEELNLFYNFIENIVMQKLKESCDKVNEEAKKEKKPIKGFQKVTPDMLKDFSEMEKEQLAKEKKEYKGLPTQESK